MPQKWVAHCSVSDATPVIEMPRYTAQLLTSADFAVISETDRLYVSVQYLNKSIRNVRDLDGTHDRPRCRANPMTGAWRPW